MNQDLSRRKDDRHPTQPLQWEDKPDLLAMRAGVNEIQREVERARAAGLTMLALPIETANAACCYVAHLGERLAESVTAAPAEQASKQVLTSINTLEFNGLLGTWLGLRDYFQSDEQPEIKSAWNALIAHIDAKLARQPAAPVAATEQATKHAAWIDQFGNVWPLGAYSPTGKANFHDAHKRGWKPLYTGPAIDAKQAVFQTRPKVPGGMAWEDVDQRAYNTACSMPNFDVRIVNLATPADAGAGEILTNERIGEIELELAKDWFSLRQVSRQAVIALSRAIEREVLARLSTSAAPVTAPQPAAQVPSIKAWHERTDECTPTATVLAMESEIADLRAALKGQPAAAHVAKEGGAK